MVKTATVFITVLAVAVWAAAPELIRLFISEDADVVRIGTEAMRLQCAAMPFLPVGVCANMTFQSIGKSALATFLSAARQGYVFLPLIMVLPRVFGIQGVEAGQPVADIITFFVCLPFLVKFLRECSGQERAESGLKNS